MRLPLFFRRTPRPPKPTWAPNGLRLYAIGDIHGRADLLDQMAARIAEDLTRTPAHSTITIFLGDYIDRGPRSAEVLERLATGSFPTPIVALRGNHEAMLLDFLGDPASLDAWRRHGGLTTLHAYGVNIEAVMRGVDFEAAQQELSARLPAHHLDFLLQTRSYHRAGDYFFCHAGVRPGTPLDRQQDIDLLSIRDEFLTSDADYGGVVVHGHSPVDTPQVLPNRIGLDTGAYATGILTCLCLEGAERRFLQVGT